MRHKYWVLSNGNGTQNFSLIFDCVINFKLSIYNNLNADPPKILILLQLRNSHQVLKYSSKATKFVSTSTEVLFAVSCSISFFSYEVSWSFNITPKEGGGPDDPKPSADMLREHSFDCVYSPIVGAVTKNSCKYFGKYRYCWVIRMLDNLVPVCSYVCQVRRILLH